MNIKRKTVKKKSKKKDKKKCKLSKKTCVKTKTISGMKSSKHKQVNSPFAVGSSALGSNPSGHKYFAQVREIYFQYLHKKIKENFIAYHCEELSSTCCEKITLQLEQEALLASIQTDVYQRAMLDIIYDVKRHTKSNHVYNKTMEFLINKASLVKKERDQEKRKPTEERQQTLDSMGGRSQRQWAVISSEDIRNQSREVQQIVDSMDLSSQRGERQHTVDRIDVGCQRERQQTVDWVDVICQTGERLQTVVGSMDVGCQRERQQTVDWVDVICQTGERLQTVVDRIDVGCQKERQQTVDWVDVICQTGERLQTVVDSMDVGCQREERQQTVDRVDVICQTGERLQTVDSIDARFQREERQQTVDRMEFLRSQKEERLQTIDSLDVKYRRGQQIVDSLDEKCQREQRQQTTENMNVRCQRGERQRTADSIDARYQRGQRQHSFDGRDVKSQREERRHTIDSDDARYQGGDRQQTIESRDVRCHRGERQQTVDRMDMRSQKGDRPQTVDSIDVRCQRGDRQQIVDRVDMRTQKREKLQTVDSIDVRCQRGDRQKIVDRMDMRTQKREKPHTVDSIDVRCQRGERQQTAERGSAVQPKKSIVDESSSGRYEGQRTGRCREEVGEIEKRSKLAGACADTGLKEETSADSLRSANKQQDAALQSKDSRNSSSCNAQNLQQDTSNTSQVESEQVKPATPVVHQIQPIMSFRKENTPEFNYDIFPFNSIAVSELMEYSSPWHADETTNPYFQYDNLQPTPNMAVPLRPLSLVDISDIVDPSDNLLSKLTARDDITSHEVNQSKSYEKPEESFSDKNEKETRNEIALILEAEDSLDEQMVEAGEGSSPPPVMDLAHRVEKMRMIFGCDDDNEDGDCRDDDYFGDNGADCGDDAPVDCGGDVEVSSHLKKLMKPVNATTKKPTIWTYEKYIYLYKYFKIAKELGADRQRKKQAQLRDLFGDDSDQENMEEYSNDEEYNDSCMARIKPVVVKFLMPYYKMQRVHGRKLFKDLAKHIADEIFVRIQYPDEWVIQHYVSLFFPPNKVYMFDSDVTNFSINEVPELLE